MAEKKTKDLDERLVLEDERQQIHPSKWFLESLIKIIFKDQFVLSTNDSSIVLFLHLFISKYFQLFEFFTSDLLTVLKK